LPLRLLQVGAALTLASWLGAGGFLLGAAQLLTGGLLLVGVVATLQWAAAAPTPGANDNGSAVAAMLTCAEQLLAQLAPDTELYVVGTGAEEVGCRGMRAFVAAHREWRPDRSFFLNFECVGGGALHYLRSEAELERTVYPPALVELARRVAASGVFGDVTPADLSAGTDGHVAAAHGYPTLSLVALEAEGVPRHYHRRDDVPEALDMPTLVRAADFGAAVAHAALRGEAGPISIL